MRGDCRPPHSVSTFLCTGSIATVSNILVAPTVSTALSSLLFFICFLPSRLLAQFTRNSTCCTSPSDPFTIVSRNSDLAMLKRCSEDLQAQTLRVEVRRELRT